MITILIYAKEFGHITNGPSKLSRYFYEAASKLSDFRLLVLTEDPPDSPMEEVYQQPMSSWATRLPLKMGKLKYSLHYHLRIIHFLEKHPDVQPDVILFTDGSSGTWTSLFGIRNIPIALMVNDDDYLTARRDGWWRKRKSRVFFWHFFVEKLATRRADLVIADAKYIYDLIVEKYGVNKEYLRILYPGIDISLSSNQTISTSGKGFAKSPLNPRRTLIKLLFVKSDYIRGGLLELIEAIALLPGYNFQLTLVGPATDPFITHQIQPPSNLRVNHLGPQPQRIVFELQQSHHVYCMPSKRDAIPISLMEALFYGNLVVSTKVGGIPEILNNGQNGYLADQCAPKAIAQALERAITDSTDNHEKKRAAGREWVKEHFNKDEMNTQFFVLMKALASKGK